MTAAQIEKVKKELGFMSREVNWLEDYETADALHRSINFILGQLEDMELRQLPATDDDVPLAA